jgi:hypothetical protein
VRVQLEFAALGELSMQKDVVLWLTAGSGNAQRYVPLVAKTEMRNGRRVGTSGRETV